MNKKECLKAALECRKPETVPLWELGFELYDQISGQELVLGFAMEKLSAGQQENALKKNAEIMLAVADDLGFSAITAPGGMWQVGPGDYAYFALPGDFPDRQLRALAEKVPSDLLLMGKTGGIIYPPSGDGYVEFAYKLYDAPDEIEERAENELISGLEHAKQLRDMGVEAVFCPADLADNHGPFFNPEHMDRFITPYLAKWAAGIREMGMYAVLHTDGNIEPIADILADSGLHAIQALDPTAGVDIARVKERVKGKLCLCGNIDCGLLITGTPEDVAKTTAWTLENCAPGGGLVLGASNSVVQETPVENYRAMMDELKKYNG